MEGPQPPEPESPEADEEFERVLRNLVNTPPKPHATSEHAKARQPLPREAK